MFMKIPEVTFDLVTGTDTLAGPRFFWSLVHGNLAIGWIPAVAQPVVEFRTNRNLHVIDTEVLTMITLVTDVRDSAAAPVGT